MASSSKQKEEVTMEEVLQEQTQLEEEANEILPFDITKCSKPLGQIRQAVYSCVTCNPTQAQLRAGVCSSCSVSCHTDHQLVELFVRRNFVCDCGTSRCNPNQCQLDHTLLPTDLENSTRSESLINRYDKNFDGQFCICERGQKYDPETETEDMYQCLACEDWRHAGCLGPHPDPEEWDDLICANCVQNEPVISSIMFKYAGGDKTGVLVCTNSEPDQVICYGRLSSTSNPECSAQPVALESSSSEEKIDGLQSQIQSNPHILPGQKSIVDQWNGKELPNGNSQHLPQETQAGDSSKKPSKGEQEESTIDASNEESPNVKRAPSPSLRNDENGDEKTAKKARLEEEKMNVVESESPAKKESNSNDLKLDCTKDQTRDHSGCRAPFQTRSNSIMNKLDPKFSNVFLVNGWRDRWCNCSNCHTILSKLDWLVHEEEEVWEPGEDTDSLKSIHELGLEAMKKLPREQLINGIMAYNQFKEEFIDFLKPFRSNNQLITDLDIHKFFQNIKSHLSSSSSSSKF